MKRRTIIGNDVKQCSGFYAAEFNFLKRFAEENIVGDELGREQFRSLWTAFCLHHDLSTDTSVYDNSVLLLWESVAESDTSEWHDFDGFDMFMCKYLV